tara:strand:+ start:369 stop:764 length:396 start_codon:yes stop_codon:yes gene_type:complete
MASILRVNTLTDASSNNSTAMSTINQGTAKNWALITVSSGTPSTDDSFNTASLTDDSTGNVFVNLTNAMSSVNYTTLFNVQVTSASGTGSFFTQSVRTSNRTTSLYRANNFENGSDTDPRHYDAQINGDLA